MQRNRNAASLARQTVNIYKKSKQPIGTTTAAHRSNRIEEIITRLGISFFSLLAQCQLRKWTAPFRCKAKFFFFLFWSLAWRRAPENRVGTQQAKTRIKSSVGSFCSFVSRKLQPICCISFTCLASSLRSVIRSFTKRAAKRANQSGLNDGRFAPECLLNSGRWLPLTVIRSSGYHFEIGLCNKERCCDLFTCWSCRGCRHSHPFFTVFISFEWSCDFLLTRTFMERTICERQHPNAIHQRVAVVFLFGSQKRNPVKLLTNKTKQQVKNNKCKTPILKD